MMTSDCFAPTTIAICTTTLPSLTALGAAHTKVFLMIYVEKLNCRMAIVLVF